MESGNTSRTLKLLCPPVHMSTAFVTLFLSTHLQHRGQADLILSCKYNGALKSCRAGRCSPEGQVRPSGRNGTLSAGERAQDPGERSGQDPESAVSALFLSPQPLGSELQAVAVLSLWPPALAQKEQRSPTAVHSISQLNKCLGVGPGFLKECGRYSSAWMCLWEAGLHCGKGLQGDNPPLLCFYSCPLSR